MIVKKPQTKNLKQAKPAKQAVSKAKAHIPPTSKQTPKQSKKHSKKQSKKTKGCSHDRFFKLFYSDPKLVQELLTLVFSKQELKAYNLNQAQVEKDTFKGKSADLIVSVPFKAFPKIKLRVFILLEHKSSYDKSLFSQLLKYQVLVREHSIQHKGYPQPIVPVVFYHGKKPLKWEKSLQAEDFKQFLSKIPLESRKSMLNYEPKVINTQDLRVRKVHKSKQYKSRGVISLLSEVWDIDKPSVLKVVEIFGDFEDILKPLSGKQQKDMSLAILEYLFDNTGLDLKTWKEAEKLIIEAGILTRGGFMNIREIIKEKGRFEGIHIGRQEGRQEGMLAGMQKGKLEGKEEERRQVIANMFQENADIPFIAKVTGLSEAEIKKFKNGAK